ncbi:structural cement protein Gp24 [Solilutibacter silvestris]|uniref:structural cement protein Gp24 n=1 Tax=Solilutibacter silvestris TaxID=1645665 RepID=UPI003D35391C
MGNAYTFRMPGGIPGDLSRQSQATVEDGRFNSSLPFPGYGLPGKLDGSGNFVPIAGGDTAAAVYGFLVRPYPTQSAQEGIGVATPPTTGISNVLRRGYMTVKSNAGTPAKGGAVFVRISAPSGAKVIGGVEAVADGANTIQLTNATFNGAADAAGNVEIAYNI